MAGDLMLLTPAQLRTLYWIARGRSIKQVSQIMRVSRRTVTSHIAMAKSKLGAHNRDEAVALAVQAGLLEIGAETIAG